MTDRYEDLPETFSSLLFHRINPERNEKRFYYIAWQATLTDPGAVVVCYGRIDGHQRFSYRPYPTLAAAWPDIRRRIQTRLRHGYHLVEFESL